ncbi:hypothetical protein HG536_0C05080 [Torulaspora globosa]|uniref:Topoisomerase I damage affected protein 2 n=1 Tax=Torulaspora globosa TaxID=48254 RepID=A0A7G3ZFQ3_9SACH|nr:uncharacterized protein HG536_0C05080 [Torulaspora globosa]QLL32339.1 hypothetical protein HG536_0C05080 [Torulaspora globosa]
MARKTSGPVTGSVWRLPCVAACRMHRCFILYAAGEFFVPQRRTCTVNYHSAAEIGEGGRKPGFELDAVGLGVVRRAVCSVLEARRSRCRACVVLCCLLSWYSGLYVDLVEGKNSCSTSRAVVSSQGGILQSMEFQILEDKVSNCPVPKVKLIDVIETCHLSAMAEEGIREGATSVVDVFLRKLLEQLNKHSTLYKYVVSMTSLSADGSRGQLSMANAVSASWNSKKDGLFNYVLDDAETSGKQYLITVIWIAK